MKHPVYWFLISSSLFASNSLSFAEASQITLTPSDSYNGNTASAEFEVKQTSSGATYTCEGNVCISYAGLSGSGLANSCFTDTAENLAFVGNGYTLCFDNITTQASNPGAINVSASDKTLNVSGFSLFSCAYCPPGTPGYGAIQTKGVSTFSGNNKLIFDHNCSTGEGGAIKCDTGSNAELKLEGNSYVVFSGNSSQKKGGAIYADKLTIVSGGPTLFSNNFVSSDSSPKGGAICIKDSGGECSLTADLGDITFDGNKIITTGSSATVKRNAIDLGSSGKFTKLRAKDGFGIFFYDPVTGGGSDELNINAKDTVDYIGKIVFSGEKLSDEEKTDTDNLKSSFTQSLKLSAGSLVLKDGVTLEAKSFTQTAGSVIMDLGTTLQTPTSSAESITLTNLDINVASLGGGGSFLLLLKSKQLQQARKSQSVLSI
ncbi:putative outer membrane protein pmp2 [Chlamydia abortus]|uniref:polymorphic outer membrane protein middle domain-containing protein n=1 Tax=Chlamydia abortus TaxID=83555 RepID=UPI001C7350B5|nr:polymorphic outer membrane protein middle domain-containing protein [Chlamydia abortus]CAG9046493.1 putative outer membrane protein pmp2 [Chlamydia abortus]